MKDLTEQWWLMLLVGVMIIVFIISSITSRKRKKLEREKRQKEVKDIIKKFMREHLSLQHKRIEFDQVVVRTSKEYRYRDVFDVVVKLYDSKSNELYATKAFEIEGFTKTISKKEFETIWKVNSELDLDATLTRINLQKVAKKKLTKKDPALKKALAAEKQAEKENLAKERIALKTAKKNAKKKVKPKTPIAEKFVGFS